MDIIDPVEDEPESEAWYEAEVDRMLLQLKQMREQTDPAEERRRSEAHRAEFDATMAEINKTLDAIAVDRRMSIPYRRRDRTMDQEGQTNPANASADEKCPNCGGTLLRRMLPMTIRYRSLSVTFEMPGACCVCGEGMVTAKDMNVSDRHLNALKAEKQLTHHL